MRYVHLFFLKKLYYLGNDDRGKGVQIQFSFRILNPGFVESEDIEDQQKLLKNPEFTFKLGVQ